MISNNSISGAKHIALQPVKKLLLSLLSKLQYGRIILHDQEERFVFSGSKAVETHTIEVRVNHPRAYRTVLFEGSIGAGKSYMRGDWESDDLQKLIEIMIYNTTLFIESPFSKVVNFFRDMIGKLHLNDLYRARKNIAAHYDLSNDFFKLFLDPTMMYSCAIFEEEAMSLEQASIKKLATICDLLQLKESDHVLEIGTGWGGFALYAAKHYGCKITTTTISNAQYQFVKKKIHEMGLENQIELLNSDYRDITGQYDKLVSIEMIEAVGHRYFDVYFEACNALLKADGLFCLQAITINDQAYERAKNEIDFIRQYIFPGGCLPSMQSITTSVARKTTLQLLHLNDIGLHYAKTLLTWLENFNLHLDEIKMQGFSEEFIRMWRFYFCYCAAGFQTRYISDIHALWRKR